MSERSPRVIKRYANRKLYDLQQSSYITHEEIAQLVRDGEDVRIIDNRSKEDLTTSTLAQILLDEEKRSTRAMPVDTIRSLFQQGGEFIQKKIKQPVVNLRDEAEKNVKRVFAGIRKDERPAPPPPEPPPQPKHRPADAIRDAIEERWQEFQSTLAQLDYPKRISELERRVALLEQALVTLVGHAAGGALEHVLHDTLALLRPGADESSDDD